MEDNNRGVPGKVDISGSELEIKIVGMKCGKNARAMVFSFIQVDLS